MAKKVAKKAAPLNTAALTGDPANPREISESAAAGLGYSMAEFGDLSGITYNLRTGELVAGHQRMGQIRQRWGDLAIEPLADDHGQIVTPAGVFPVRFVDWPKTKQRAANIAANSPEISGQFTDALFDQLAEIKAESPDLYDGLLFEALDREQPVDPVDEDTAPEPQIDVVTRPGDLWTIDQHKLCCGDCRDAGTWERLLGGERVDAVVTDPPYGVDWDTDYTRFTSGARNTKVVYPEIKGDKQPFDPSPWLNFETVVLWGANIFSARLPVGTWLIWDKREDNGTAWLADAEIAWMKGGYGVYICPHCGPIRENRGIHPTQKRVDVVAWTIEKSKAGELIADPYCGSGTTIMACQHLGRRCFACEIEPAYVDVCLRRYRAKYPEASITRHDGATWEACQ